MRGCMGAAKEMIYGTFFLVQFKIAGVNLEDGLDINITVKRWSRDRRVLFLGSLALTRLHRLKIERMHLHTGRRYYFPIFSVLIQSLQKRARESLGIVAAHR